MRLNVNLLIFFWLFVLHPRVAAASCVLAYESATLKPLTRVMLVGPTEICDGKIPADKLSKLRYLEGEVPPDLARGSKILIEVKGKNREIRHVLRGGKYYGEFIDDVLNDTRGHLRTHSLLLERLPDVDFIPATLADLNFIESEENYVWSADRVREVKRRHRRARINAESVIVPVTNWKESLLIRRLVRVELTQRKPGEVFIESYYYDPAFHRPRFFRRFKDTGDSQRTVVQFAEAPAGRTHPAFLHIVRGEELFQKVELSDPGTDDLPLQVNLTE